MSESSSATAIHGWGRRLASGRVALAIGLALLAACATTTGSAPVPELAPVPDDPAVPARSSGWSPGQPGIAARRATGQAEVGEARRTLETTGDACGLACPALVALRLGASHLCSISDTKDDAKVCKEVRAEVTAVQARLKPSCGDCSPHGEPDAGADDPVP